MARRGESPIGMALNAFGRFQTNERVRAAEAALLVVFVGGFYLVALVRILFPYGRGVTYTLLTAASMELRVALTVVVPFCVVVLEWLSALSQVRQQPGYDGWNLGQRLYVWMEITTVVQNSVTLVYVPILPVALVWTIIAGPRGQPFWVVPAAVVLIDTVAIVGAYWFVNTRQPERLPPGTALHRLGWREGWI
jgi:hypothetical protein